MSNSNHSMKIEIQDLYLSFGTTEVLKGVDLTIEAGEFFSFLGPSGSGKSTLLRSIAGFGPTPKGRILIGGEDVTQLPPYKRNVGMVFQNYALWPHMTVRKNVAFGLEERKLSKQEVNTRVDQALELVELLHLADRRPSELSGGQQQRIALARTVVVEPRVLLLDEPLSNLDANLRVQMRRDILKLQRKLGITTIFVTHDQEEANTTSDRLAVLNDGIIQQIGTPTDLYDTPSNRFVADFLGTANILDRSKDNTNTQQFITDKGLILDISGLKDSHTSLVFRPQSTLICYENNALSDDHIKLTGTVKHREFLGSQVRYGVDVCGHLLSIDEIHQIGKSHIEEGETMSIEVPRSQLVLVE